MTKENWTIEIKPKKKWLDIDLKGIWRYRDLYYMYVKRDIVTVYKQTILGPLWFLIQPIFTTVMYMFIFGGLAGISTDGVPQPLFYMAGIMLWNYFSSAFNVSSNVFTANAGVFGKVYFPRLVVPLSGITSNLIKFGIQLLLFIAMYLYFYVKGASLHVNAALLLFPFLTFLIAFHAMSWGLIVSALTTKYRDLTQLVTFGLQLFMYATPVIYPLNAAPEKYRDIIALNPLTPIFETFKYSCMGCGSLIAWVHTDFEKHHWTNVIFKNKQNEEQTYSRYHQIVTVSVTVQKAFIKAFPLVKSLVKIIYNPIDHEDIIKKGKQYEPLPSKSKIRLISIGRLTKVKAYSRLLHIALRLKQSGYAFELWILGDGEEREMLQHYICKKQLEDCVTLWGFQTNPYAFMTQSDLFVCSSISEGYSTAVTEALILGLPVVTTDCSGMNELLQGEKYGIITENSEATLFEGIKQLLDHPEQLSHYKEKVIKRGKEFTLEVLMKPIETLLTR